MVCEKKERYMFRTGLGVLRASESCTALSRVSEQDRTFVVEVQKNDFEVNFGLSHCILREIVLVKTHTHPTVTAI
jgi:hypothetical protein